MPTPPRRFTVTFSILRAAHARLDLHHTPSTRKLEGIARQYDKRDVLAECRTIRAQWKAAIEAEVAAVEHEISTWLGMAEHTLEHIGYRPERREEFAKAAQSMLTVLIANLRKIAPRTDADFPLPDRP